MRATPRAQVVQLDLGDRAFEYAAGQAVLVGAHGAETRLPYSLCGAPEDARRDRVLELLMGTEPVEPEPNIVRFTPLPGLLVDVEGPVGSFVFPAAAHERRFLFLAGGTGIAPLRAMLRHALTVPHDAIGLFYSARTPEEFAYEQELRGLAAEGRIELVQTVTRWSGEWTGARGRVNRDALAALVHDVETLCFLCGPAALVEEVPKQLQDIGISRTRIRIEEWK